MKQNRQTKNSFTTKAGKSRISSQLLASFFVSFAALLLICIFVMFRFTMDVIKTNMNDTFLIQINHSEEKFALLNERVENIVEGLGTNIYSFKARARECISLYGPLDAVLYISPDGAVRGVCADGSTLNAQAPALIKSHNPTATGEQWVAGFTRRTFFCGEQDMEYFCAARTFTAYGNGGALLLCFSQKSIADSLIINSSAKDVSSCIMSASYGLILGSELPCVGSSLSNLSSNRDLAKLNPGEFTSFFVSDDTVFVCRLAHSDWYYIIQTSVISLKKSVQQLALILTALTVTSLWIALIISNYWINIITRPLEEITKATKQMATGKLEGKLNTNYASKEFVELAQSYNAMTLSMEEMRRKQHSLQQERLVVEMQFLRAQINPHFIYNTLNNIKWMAIVKQDNEIAESITTLSDILRPVFRYDDMICSLSEELAYIEDYIKIMNFRFSGGLSLHIKCPDDLRNAQILRFILQPLVENAIYHGINEEGTGDIQIKVALCGDTLELSVQDKGAGMDSARLSDLINSLEVNKSTNAGHVGLSNVARRMRLQYSSRYIAPRIVSEVGHGTCVTLSIPYAQYVQGERDDAQI